eukprot:6177968-Pleurochrysis_carterae.AAC.1
MNPASTSIQSSQSSSSSSSPPPPRARFDSAATRLPSTPENAMGAAATAGGSALLALRTRVKTARDLPD